MGPLLDRCWEICFFFCACAGLVHLVVWCFFDFCWCLPMLHKHQKTKWKWSKHRQAPKKNKETFQQLWAHFWIGAGNSVFFFYGACAGLVHLVVWCFLFFFSVCQCFVKSESPNLQRHQKNKTNKVEVEETSTGTKNKKQNF